MTKPIDSKIFLYWDDGSRAGHCYKCRVYLLISFSRSGDILLEILIPHGNLGQLVTDPLMNIKVFRHTTVYANAFTLEKYHVCKFQEKL